MEFNDNKITFNIEKKKLNQLKLASSILEMSLDELFQLFIDRTIEKALRGNREFNIRTYVGPLNEPLKPEIMVRRIHRWARDKGGYAYKIIKIFFELYDKDSNNIVKRKDMIKEYKNLFNIPNATTQFLITFRMMCSNSRTAYGYIFEYHNNNQEDEVVLHPLNKELILSLKEEFSK